MHITRGALGLIKTEAELAGVLGARDRPRRAEAHGQCDQEKQGCAAWHQRNAVATEARFSIILANRAYGMVLENSFDRGDELDADKEGVVLVQKAGYAGAGARGFPARLAERNKNQAEKNGLFASHPETQERIGKVKQLAGSKPGATVAARYTSTIKYQPTEITQIASDRRRLGGTDR